jgi:hypothetical protein
VPTWVRHISCHLDRGLQPTIVISTEGFSQPIVISTEGFSQPIVISTEGFSPSGETLCGTLPCTALATERPEESVYNPVIR